MCSVVLKQVVKAPILMAFLLVLGCSESSVIGEDLVESTDFSLNKIDTFKVSMNTIQYDSVVTSENTQLIIGNRQDTELGDFSAAAYFLLSYDGTVVDDAVGSTTTVDEDITYDSITLSLYPADYSLYLDEDGERISITLEQLPSLLNPDGDALYNVYEQTGVTDQETLEVLDAKENYFFDPAHPDPSIEFRLPDELGEALYDSLLEGAEIFSSATEMHEYLNGFRIRLTGENTPILSFAIDSINMQIHATDPRGAQVVNVTYEFGVNGASYFTKVDHTNIPEGLDIEDIEEEVGSNALDNKAYISGLLGYAVKINLNNLRNLLLDGSDFLFTAAELQVSFLDTEHDEFPSTLSGFLIDEDNNAVESGLDLELNAVYDDEYNRDQYYTLDLTAVTSAVINSDKTTELFLMIRTQDFTSSLTSVVLGDQTYDTQIITYTISNN